MKTLKLEIIIAESFQPFPRATGQSEGPERTVQTSSFCFSQNQFTVTALKHQSALLGCREASRSSALYWLHLTPPHPTPGTDGRAESLFQGAVWFTVALLKRFRPENPTQ